MAAEGYKRRSFVNIPNLPLSPEPATSGVVSDVVDDGLFAKKYEDSYEVTLPPGTTIDLPVGAEGSDETRTVDVSGFVMRTRYLSCDPLHDGSDGVPMASCSFPPGWILDLDLYAKGEGSRIRMDLNGQPIDQLSSGGRKRWASHTISGVPAENVARATRPVYVEIPAGTYERRGRGVDARLKERAAEHYGGGALCARFPIAVVREDGSCQAVVPQTARVSILDSETGVARGDISARYSRDILARPLDTAADRPLPKTMTKTQGAKKPEDTQESIWTPAELEGQKRWREKTGWTGGFEPPWEDGPVHPEEEFTQLEEQASNLNKAKGISANGKAKRT